MTKPIVIASYCNKGGVGKTTFVHNIGYLIAKEANLKVLLVDADPQCNLSGQLLKTPNRILSKQELENREQLVEDFYDENKRNVLKSNDDNVQFDIYDCFKSLIDINFDNDSTSFMARAAKVRIVETKYENLFLLPGSNDFYKVNTHVAASTTDDNSAINRKKLFAYLTNYLREIGKINDFDLIIIDLNPGISMMNVDFILGSDYFFIPTYPDSFTRQGIQTIQKNIKDWVKGTDTYREHEREDLRLGLPAKFLGYVSLRYPTKRQQKNSENAYDVVAAYDQWWKLIHELIKSKLLDTLKSIDAKNSNKEFVRAKMFHDHFKLFRLGVRNFASLGERSQFTGEPVTDTSLNDDQPKRQEFKESFMRIISGLFGNMSPEHLHELGFIGTTSYSLIGNCFGFIKPGDGSVKLIHRTDRGDNEFCLLNYSPRQDAINFCGLPIPMGRREIAIRLNPIKNKHLKGSKLMSVKKHLAQEMIELSLKQLENNLSLSLNFLFSRSQPSNSISNIDALKGLLGARKKLENNRLSISERQKQKEEAEKFYGILEQRCMSVSRGNQEAFCSFIERNNSFQYSFNFNGKKIDFSERNCGLIQAVFLSFMPDDDSFGLSIWGLVSQENGGQLISKICFFGSEVEKKQVHLFLDQSGSEDVLKLMIPSKEMRLTDQNAVVQQEKSYDNQNTFLTDSDIDYLIEHFLRKNALNDIDRLRTYHYSGNENNPDDKNLIAQMSEAIHGDKITVIPICASENSVGHWCGLIIYPRDDVHDKARIIFVDSLHSENPFLRAVELNLQVWIRRTHSELVQFKSEVHNQQAPGTADCGIFLVSNLINILTNKPVVDGSEITSLRSQYALLLQARDGREYHNLRQKRDNSRGSEHHSPNNNRRLASQAGLMSRAPTRVQSIQPAGHGDAPQDESVAGANARSSR